MPQPKQIDEALIRCFEDAWQDGDADIGEYLPVPLRAEFVPTLCELVLIDLEFRWKQATTRHHRDDETALFPHGIEAYLARYPLLDQPDIVDWLASEEFSIRWKYGDQPSLRDYQERFPGFDADLPTLHQQTHRVLSEPPTDSQL